MNLQKVMRAKPFRDRTIDGRYDAFSSFGDADTMLLDQLNFPYEYDKDLDRLAGADNDRLRSWNREEYDRICAEFQEKGGRFQCYGRPEGGPMQWFLNNLFHFCTHNPKPIEELIEYTGYRIVGSIRRDNGYPYYGFDVFLKHPDTKTKLYSSFHAPNVEGYENAKERSYLRDYSVFGGRYD